MDNFTDSLSSIDDDRYWLYKDNASGYEDYLQREYDQNFQDMRREWEGHYRKMQEALLMTLMEEMERKNKKRDEMHAAIFGPGMDPANRDIGLPNLHALYARFASFTTIDYSVGVSRSALRSLVGNGMPESRLFSALYDFTGGMSTVQHEWVQEKLAEADPKGHFDEPAFARALEQMANSRFIEEMEERLERKLNQSEKSGSGQLDGSLTSVAGLRAATTNRMKNLHLVHDGKPIELDHMFIPFVLAGTGVLAEHLLWEAFGTTTCATDRSSGDAEPSKELVSARKEMLRRIHKIITSFSTEVSGNGLVKVFEAHPHATVLAVTDVTTRSLLPPYSGLELPRIDTMALEKYLETQGIAEVGSPVPRYYFQDSIGHSHNVHATTFRKNTTSS